MKKIFIIMIAAAAVLLTNTPSFAENEPNLLSVSGTATINTEPDTVVCTLAVETENKLLAKAAQENNEKSNKVIAEVKKFLGKEDTIKTSSFNVYPVYNYDNRDRKNVLIGYKAANSIIVKTKKISDIGKIIDSAIRSGANRVDNLSFSVENKDKYAAALLKQAASEAKQKASVTAQALGVSIKGVKRASVNVSDDIAQPYYRANYASMAKGVEDAASSPVPVEPGEVKLNASVMVDFIIENAK